MKRKVEKLQKEFAYLKEVVKSSGMAKCQLSLDGHGFKTVPFGFFIFFFFNFSTLLIDSDDHWIRIAPLSPFLKIYEFSSLFYHTLNCWLQLDPASFQPRNKRNTPDSASNDTSATQAPLPGTCVFSWQASILRMKTFSGQLTRKYSKFLFLYSHITLFKIYYMSMHLLFVIAVSL